MNIVIKKLEDHLESLRFRFQDAQRQEEKFRNIAQVLDIEAIKLANTIHEIKNEAQK